MKKLIAMIALGAAAVSTPALAQGGGFMQRDMTRQEAQQRADMMFQMLDANHDGTVTRAEAEQAAAQFAARSGGDQGGRGGNRLERMINEGSTTIVADRWRSRPRLNRMAIWIAYGIVRLAMGFLGYGRNEWFRRDP